LRQGPEQMCPPEIFICGIDVDIAEQKKAEELLREQADIINPRIVARDFHTD
jgi:hypothetical protein